MGIHTLQKHEREVLALAREILEPAGFQVDVKQAGPKVAMCAHKPGVPCQRKKISSSPKSVKVELDWTRRWAKKVAKM